jgi:hypothetical protein
MSDKNTRYKPYENVYRPIEESEYRVIHLLPGTFTDDIRCVLEIRPEHVMTSYEAVSYQWGDESITRPISVAPMRSGMATRWPLLESANIALKKLLKVVQFYLTPPIPLWILAWCMGSGFVWHHSSSLPENQLPFIPRDIHSVGISAILGVGFAQGIGLLISSAIEITETKPLFFLLDLVFDPSLPGHPMEFTTLRVTTNLESALRHLRKEKQIRTLWVDALCIDQKNEDEKRAQVQRMDRIYANATSTTIWLGGYHGLEEPERCGGRKSGDCEHSRQIETAFKYVRLIRGWRTFLRLNDSDKQSLFLASRQGLVDLATRGWWKRLWVIQEVSLSTGRVYIRCGHNACDFEDFRSALYTLFDKYADLMYDFMPSIHIMTTIKEFSYSSAHSPSFPFFSTHSFQRLWFPRRLQEILLRTSGRFRCRDDRDRLYAVLGIAAGVTEDPRRKIAFFIRGRVFCLLTIVIVLLCSLAVYLNDWKTLSTLYFPIGLLSLSIWPIYDGSIVRYRTISRPEYITLRYMRDLDDFKGGESDRAGFFTALGGYLAQRTGNLSFLDAVSCGEDGEDTIPSWVPDWSKEISVSAYEFAKRLDWTWFQIADLNGFLITDAGKTLQVEGRCRTVIKVVRAADLQKVQSLPLWQNGFGKTAALPSQERPAFVRLLWELGRLTSPDHTSKLRRSEKRRALWLFFRVNDGLKAGLGRMLSRRTTIAYTDNAIAEGMGYLESGKVKEGDRLFSVPSSYYYMVLRQAKSAYRCKIVGLVDMEHTENWSQLKMDGRLQTVAIE